MMYCAAATHDSLPSGDISKEKKDMELLIHGLKLSLSDFDEFYTKTMEKGFCDFSAKQDALKMIYPVEKIITTLFNSFGNARRAYNKKYLEHFEKSSVWDRDNEEQDSLVASVAMEEARSYLEEMGFDTALISERMSFTLQPIANGQIRLTTEVVAPPDTGFDISIVYFIFSAPWHTTIDDMLTDIGVFKLVSNFSTKRQELENLVPHSKLMEFTESIQDGYCTICMENIENIEDLEDTTDTEGRKPLNCSHTFHKKCLFQFLQSNDTCPVCRNQVC